MARSLLVLLAVLAATCGGHRPPPLPLFPLTSTWRVPLEAHVAPPLAADSRRVYVATRDGAVSALDQETGAVAWRVERLDGPPAATDGQVIVRREDGTVFSLRPRDGRLRWKAETGVAGSLPATLDGDRLYVAGHGLIALDAESGRRLWTDPHGAKITAPPVATTSYLLVGDGDGVLRCVDRATGVTLWSRLTGGPVLAPVLVDERRGRVYVGTTDRGILELSLERGEPGWRWRLGADVQAGGLLLPDRVVFAGFDAVLWALNRGGNLAWRAPLPSRPLGSPLLVRGYIVVVCHENEILGFTTSRGRPAGSLRTTAEIRTPPLLAGSRIVVALRDRSVVAYGLAEGTAEPGLEEPGLGNAPAEEPSVEDRERGR